MVNWISLKPLKEFSLDELKDLLIELHHFSVYIIGDKCMGDYINFHLEILEEMYNLNSKNPDLSHCFSIRSFENNNEKSYYDTDLKIQIANKYFRKLQVADSRFNDFELQSNYEY